MSNALQNPFRIAFVGDVALSGEFIAAAKPPGNSLVFPFSTINKELDEIDLFFLNLEGPIGSDGEPRKGVTSHIYNEPIIIEWLRRFPLCVCNLANNHVMDYGDKALLRTKNLLEKNGIHCVGAGINYEEASSPLIVYSKGRKFGFLGLTTNEPHVGSVLANDRSPGCAGLRNHGAIRKQVYYIANQVDNLIISIHWGYEYFNYPSPDQIALGRLFVDSGATIVVGHHPHVAQGVEPYRQGLISYSLGNFLLPELRAMSGRIQYRKPITKQYSLLKVELYGNKLSNWQLQGGRCTKKYELLPFRRVRKEQFKSFIGEISCPLKLPNYDIFWQSYKKQRIRQLQKEDFLDAISKFLVTDLRIIISTLSINDFKRNLVRFVRLFLNLFVRD